MEASFLKRRPEILFAATLIVGLLMLVVMLRWRGWNVKYLGPDLPLERLEEALEPLQPLALMFSANRTETASKLAELSDIIKKFPAPHPKIILGGQAFQQVRLPEQLHGIYLNGSPNEIVQQIEELLLNS